jgi:hypothetical protein
MKGPYPTHGFFTNALFSRGEPVQAHPYLYSNRDNGIAVGYDEPELILDATTQIQQWRSPFGSFLLEGVFQNRSVESYESLSFVQRWFHNTRNNFMTVNTVCGMKVFFLLFLSFLASFSLFLCGQGALSRRTITLEMIRST